MANIFHYKIRWHLILVHFPISFFTASFVFQILHLIFALEAGSFTLGSIVMALSGTIALIPTVISGWLTWKQKYKGASTVVFKRKIITGFAMLVISIPLTLWRILLFDIHLDEPFRWSNYLLLFGTTLLVSGAVIEGYFGEKLTHRD